MFVITRNGCSSRHETFRIVEQWLWDHAVKFSRWQHPAMGRGAKFAVPGTSSYLQLVDQYCCYCNCSYNCYQCKCRDHHQPLNWSEWCNWTPRDSASSTVVVALVICHWFMHGPLYILQGSMAHGSCIIARRIPSPCQSLHIVLKSPTNTGRPMKMRSYKGRVRVTSDKNSRVKMINNPYLPKQWKMNHSTTALLQ